ncbi:hypothetical protein [Variovorax sp. SRS16]|uniref:hypothetical protein n=1 Tax=Variovorax sp. SRS16 TaxID=282217 RepID=UPI0013A574F3|nr:hypothetical protein [Variovorax sp. SRS16]
MTATDRQDFIAQIKSHGFLGYVVKAMPAAEFLSALAKVLAGEQAFPVSGAPHAMSTAIRITRRQAEGPGQRSQA